MNQVVIIVAMSKKDRAIGKQGNLPWDRNNLDLKFFKKITSETIDSTKINAVVMGRKTWESIPEKRRPLANRLNVVISRDTIGLEVIDKLRNNPLIETVFIIGGGEIYRQVLLSYKVSVIYVTEIDRSYDNCDTFFPEIDKTKFKIESVERLNEYTKIIKYICQ